MHLAIIMRDEPSLLNYRNISLNSKLSFATPLNDHNAPRLAEWPIVINYELLLQIYRVVNIPFYALVIKTKMTIDSLVSAFEDAIDLKVAAVSIGMEKIYDDYLQNIIVVPYRKGSLCSDQIEALLVLHRNYNLVVEEYGLIDNFTHTFLLSIERKLRKKFFLMVNAQAVVSGRANDGFMPKLAKKEIVDFIGDEYSHNLFEANILVKITMASICQSDRRVLFGTKNSCFYTRDIVLGHEGGGYIVDPGPWSDTLRPGQKIVCLPHLSCGTCDYCNANLPNLCRNLSHIGFHLDGCFAEFVLLPRQTVRALDDGFLDDAMPMIEPLACVVRALGKLRPQLDDLNNRYKLNDANVTPFTIYGSGPMGCIIATTAKIL